MCVASISLLRTRLFRAIAAIVLSVASCFIQAAEVQVAVAANFAGPFDVIAAKFAAETGHKVLTSTGSTGKFYTQIANGAPFDVLLAADDETPARLVKEGHAIPASVFTYATGKLVLWSARPGLVDDKGAVLAAVPSRADIAHVAIGDPRVVPYGRAAEETLRALKLYDALKPRFVVAESIAQSYQFVSTGNAAIGFVALSQVAVPGKAQTGSMWVVPADLHEPIRQDAALLKRGAGNPAATALLAFLRTAAARETIRAYGYELLER